MDLKKTMACRYLLTREPGDKTNVAVEFFVRGNPLLQMIFRS